MEGPGDDANDTDVYLRCGIFNDESAVNPIEPFWTHLFVRWQENEQDDSLTEIEVYRDGVLCGETTTDQVADFDSRALFVGGAQLQQPNNLRNFDGLIDEVYVFDRNLDLAGALARAHTWETSRVREICEDD